MTPLKAIAAALFASTLSACGGTPVYPDVMLSAQQKQTLHLVTVTVEASPDVMMSTDALDRILHNLKTGIQAETPQALAAPAPGATELAMKIVFTQYDGANAGMRFVNPGGGVIRIQADVYFVAPSGAVIAKWDVARQFGSGGYGGLTTDILNVEDSFEKAVVDLLR